MSINIDTNEIVKKLYSSVDSYKAKLQNTDDKDFARYLKNNFDAIDSDNSSLLSKDEIAKNIEQNKANPDLQKILENSSLEKMLSNIDMNADNSISQKEVDPGSNLNDIFKSSYNDFQNNRNNLGSVVANLTNKLCQNYHLNDSLKSLTSSAINLML